MSRLRPSPERHFVNRIGWLRAAVLGANNGIISTASLIVGVAVAATTQDGVFDRRCLRTGGWRYVDGHW
jgi:VIT1/CCC1 family predicted Fe2+/Mn2+ transporter